MTMRTALVHQRPDARIADRSVVGARCGLVGLAHTGQVLVVDSCSCALDRRW